MSIITENKHLIHLTKINNKDLENILIKNLPQMIRGGLKKVVNRKTRYGSAWAIHNLNFIEYNTKNTTSITVLDFDKISNNETIKDRYPSIFLFNKYFLSEYLEVNFIVETNRGYQAFIVWNSRLNSKHWKSWNLLKRIKAGFIKDIPYLDKIATNRNNGIYRNPLAHKTEIYNLEPFGLYDFKDSFAVNDTEEEEEGLKSSVSYGKKEIQHRKQTSKEKEISKTVKPFLKMILEHKFIELKEGIRKATLFQAGMLKARHLKTKEALNLELENYLNFLNKKHCSPTMPPKEIIDLKKSIIAYELNGENKVKYPDDMTFKSRKEINKDYYKKHKGAKTMTRQENLKKVHKDRTDLTEKKVLNLITGVFKEEFIKKNGKWNVAKISDFLKISRTTIYKYLPEV